MGSEEVDLDRLERPAKEMVPRERGEMSWLSKGRTCAGGAVYLVVMGAGPSK